MDSDRLKLFVGGLSRETSDVALREHFSRYGVVVDCTVATDRITGTHRGFGFITFRELDAFERALRDCHVILQKRVDVKQAIPRSEQLRNQHQSNGLSRTNNNNTCNSSSQFRTKKIFVGGLSPNLTENEFKSYFAQFGTITDVVVMQDNMTNRPRGFGFITFDSEETVQEVTRKSFHELGGKLVEVKRAVPKEESSFRNNHYSSGENGRNSLRENHFENLVPYSDAYSIVPVFRPITVGYPYAPPIPFSPFFPVPVTSLLSPPPIGSFSTFCPAYLGGGVGVLGAPNGVIYNGFPNLGVYKDSSELGNGYGSSVQITEISN